MANDKQHIFDAIRKKYVLLTPEEWVRQNLLAYLTQTLHYPAGLIAVEKMISVNQLRKRYDIVVYDKMRNPWMLIECKAPTVAVSDDTLQQLLQYYSIVQCPYWMLTNGHQNYCASVENGLVRWLAHVPVYNG